MTPPAPSCWSSTGAHQITPEPASGSFDVDASGTITGGEVHTALTSVSDAGECHFAFDSDTASGTIAASEAGATGQVVTRERIGATTGRRRAPA